MEKTSELITIKQASEWASRYLKRNVTTSNISYLIQYGRVEKFNDNGSTLINVHDLARYYESYVGKRETDWTNKLGADLIWALSFDYLKESERTKHVHRLHPYKGKFIPQLVEYFLDDHTDEFKREIYFNKGDVVLDPFCGSGTTLVQANELGMHAIGIDVSSFNALVSNVKTSKYNLSELYSAICGINLALKQFIANTKVQKFENALLEALTDFNNKFFPSPDFKIKVRLGEINEEEYGKIKEKEFGYIYKVLVYSYGIPLRQEDNYGFLSQWYLTTVRREIEFVHTLIEQIKDPSIRNILTVILSRTIRSCRATTHFDLATLKEPVFSTYYCHKHGKICKPIFSILGWWLRYSEDTIKRLSEFDKLRTNTTQICLTGDSRVLDIDKELETLNLSLAHLIRDKKIKGIFSSPPYVGLINYHDQHAYAYDLFDLERKDELEIGALSNGQGIEARKSYIQAITDVLVNCQQFLTNDYNIFIVANDKFNLYPLIAENSNMKIIRQYKRPVLNRTERDKGAYAETIFHMRGK